MGALKYAIAGLVVLIVLIAACGKDVIVGPPIDTVPPNPPVGVGITGEVGDLVRISWSQNAELDLAGYRVYRASSEDEVFMQASARALVCPWYYDHVPPMNVAYFKVTAVDESGNESAFSRAVGIYVSNGWRNPPREPQDSR